MPRPRGESWQHLLGRYLVSLPPRYRPLLEPPRCLRVPLPIRGDPAAHPQFSQECGCSPRPGRAAPRGQRRELGARRSALRGPEAGAAEPTVEKLPRELPRSQGKSQCAPPSCSTT